MRRLKGKVTAVTELTSLQKDRMFALLSWYFANIKREVFDQDLQEKDGVVLLEDLETGTIQGFSTMLIMNGLVQTIPVTILFSGDTIISRDYWGESELGRAWLRHIFYELAPGLQGRKFYWYLLSKGYKTYRFLPVYFYKYYPGYDRPTPELEQAVMDYFGSTKYPGQYNPSKGIIHFAQQKDYLKPGVAAITQNRLKDPHVSFFLEKNPGHEIGDELVCLAELSLDNLKPFGHKLLGKDSRSINHAGAI